jgi:hypothetical protein
MTSIFPPWDWNRPYPAAFLPGGPWGPAGAAMADSLLLPAHVASATPSTPAVAAGPGWLPAGVAGQPVHQHAELRRAFPGVSETLGMLQRTATRTRTRPGRRSAAMSNPRLPADYPSARSQIVDYLLHAGNGADLQILKVETWDCNGGRNQK